MNTRMIEIWMVSGEYGKIGCPSRTIFREKNWMLPHDFSDRKN